MSWLRLLVPNFFRKTRAILNFQYVSGHPNIELSEDVIWMQRAIDRQLRYAMSHKKLWAMKIGDVIYFLELQVSRTPHPFLEWDERLKTYKHRGICLKDSDVFVERGFSFVYTKL